MKLDFKNVFLSIGGGLVVVFAGYAVWRHEQTIQAAQQAQQNAAQQNVADQTIAALQNQVQQMQASQGWAGYGASYGSTTPDYSQVSGTTLASVPQDTNLATILAAFLGQQSGQVSTAGSSTAAVTNAQSSTSPTGASDSHTTTALTPSTQTQVSQIPDSLLYNAVVPLTTGNYAMSGINGAQASNPVVTSTIGAASGNPQPASGSRQFVNQPIVVLQGAQ